MPLALFDLDNTLLATDSDHAWGEFLVRLGRVDAEEYKKANDGYLRAYQEGRLDIDDYLRFSLRPLARYPMEDLLAWRAIFMETVLRPQLLEQGRQRLQEHRDKGDCCIIITATNRFITQPVADELGVEHLLAVEPEQVNGRYTGRVKGVPSFREGKITCLEHWLAAHPEQSLEGSFFYSDSHNDLPLLKKVTHPVAVDPDPQLRAFAEAAGWPVISLREVPFG